MFLALHALNTKFKKVTFDPRIQVSALKMKISTLSINTKTYLQRIYINYWNFKDRGTDININPKQHIISSAGDDLTCSLITILSLNKPGYTHGFHYNWPLQAVFKKKTCDIR